MNRGNAFALLRRSDRRVPHLPIGQDGEIEETCRKAC